MRFNYTGITRTKERVAGTLEAADEVEARMRLRAMQIRPISLGEKASAGFTLKFNVHFGSPVKLKQMLVFTRQFSSLIDSGVPVVQCLDILYDQEKRGNLKRVLKELKEHIESGGSLAEGMGKHPRVFSEFFIRIVEAGELSGTLDQALRRVGLQLEKLGKLKKKVIAALLYPIVTLLVAIGVIIFMLVKVIPTVAQLYADNSAALPELTVFVLNLSDFVRTQFTTMMVLAAGLFFGSVFLYRIPAAREIIDPLLLRVPLFGDLMKKATIARFSRTMSTLISSGVPLLNAFEVCEKIVSNVAIQQLIRRASAAVAEGKSIAQGLSSNMLFPSMVVHMVNIGEMTGKLDDLMAKVADIYDDEVDDAVNNLTGLLQPILIVCVGGIVAFLLVAMYLPVFQLAEKVSGGG